MIDDLLNKIEYSKYSKLSKEKKDITILSNHIIEVFDTLNISEKLTIIDVIFSYGNSSLIYEISKDKNILKYMLEHEILKGKELEKLKDPNAYSLEVSMSIISGTSPYLIQAKKILYKRLAEYINNTPNINEEIESMTNEFAILFVDYYNNYRLDEPESLNIFEIITALFNTEYNVNHNCLEEIYDKLITKQPIFASYDYKELFKSNIETLGTIKGIINEVPQDFLYELLNIKEATDEDWVELSKIIDKAYQINADDEESLYYFFILLKEMKEEQKEANKLYEILEQKEYYQKYSNEETMLESLKEVSTEIKEGKYVKHNKHYLECLGATEYLDDTDTLKLFMENNNPEYKRQLIIPILVHDILKLKNEVGLDFNVSFEINSSVEGLCGFYCEEEDTLFINRTLIEAFEDPLDALIQCEDTFAHEIRHAKQYKELEEKQNFNYNNLLMAMELTIHKISSLYYTRNYKNISFEQDARAEGYVYTMTYFKDYPEVQERIKNNFEEQIDAMTYHIKEDPAFVLDDKFYSTIINQFEETFGMGKEDYMREYDKIRYELYPILSIVFDQDPTTGKVKLKSKEYFENLKQGYLSLKDCKEKEEALKCIELIEYQRKISEYMNQYSILKDGRVRVGIEDGIENEFKSYEELKERIEQELGPSPRR